MTRGHFAQEQLDYLQNLHFPSPARAFSPSPLVGEGWGEGGSGMTRRQAVRQLRQNATDAERALWYQLRAARLDGHKFRRQASIGRYIVDFVCFEARLIVEVDGGQHAERQRQDAQRTAWLASQGFRVLRFWNPEVLGDMAAVKEAIMRACAGKPPSP